MTEKTPITEQDCLIPIYDEALDSEKDEMGKSYL